MGTTQPARQRNRRGEGARLRADIVQAASELLTEPCDEETLSLRAVARRTGVTAPSLYLHFADKAELVEAVLRERFADLAESIEAATEDLEDPAMRLRARAHAFVAFGLDNPGHFRLMYEGRGLADLRAVPWPGNGQGIQSSLEADIAALAERDGTAGTDTGVKALLLWQALHGVIALRIGKPEVDWRPAQDDTDAMLAALFGSAGD